VDHAGLSLQLVQLKELNSLLLENLLLILNNNSLIAQLHSEMKVVMEDLWIMLSNISRKTHLNLNLIIHTQVLMELANTSLQRELVKSHHSLMLLQTLLINLRLLLHLDQFQLLLKLTDLYSNLTLQELSQANFAEPILITESSQSDMELKVEKITSLLKTHGVHHGELKDS
jgi:hypothetical protein